MVDRRPILSRKPEWMRGLTGGAIGDVTVIPTMQSFNPATIERLFKTQMIDGFSVFITQITG
jgi:hypothetical protein